MSDSPGEQVATLKMNDGQYGDGSATRDASASSSSWLGAWSRNTPTAAAPATAAALPQPLRLSIASAPRSFAATQTTQQWLKQSLLACCCIAPSRANDIRTRRSPGGVLRKVDDLELHRRRSTAALLEPPNSSDSGKALSFGRARNSGVNRLLRSTTSSCGSSANGPTPAAVPTSTANYASAFDVAPAISGSIASPPGAPTISEQVASANGSDPASNSSFHSAIDDTSDGHNGAAVVPEYQGHYFPDHVWRHVVLKMTAFTDDDVVTSFRFDTAGGTIGRDPSPANTASVPADKLMNRQAHAKILYAHGGFYLQNCDEQSSGTFVRLGPSCEDDDDVDDMDDDGGRMQWPLDVHVAFRAGKSDFVVTAVNELEQTLELAALSGKLEGTVFTVTPDGAGIGRSADNEIHAGDGELSRKHAAIWFDELTHKFYLIDLGSTNGTFVKLAGPYNEPYRLEIGDDVLVSQTCLTVSRFDFGVHASMGARKYMEDAHTIIQDLNIESLSCLGLHPQSFFAVYDGHGGDEASAFLGDTLHHNVIDAFRFKKKQFDPLLQLPRAELCDMICQRLVSAFEKTDDEFLHESARPQAGSTATTVFIAGSHLFVANVGDSRTVLSRKRVAVRLSNDHKPSRADEAQRIRDTGGFVIHGRIMGELAVSRAFGDSPFKVFDFPEPSPKDVDGNSSSSNRSSSSGTSGRDDAKARSSEELPVNPNDILKGPLVIPTPEITTTELSDDDEFLLLASDGLFDVLRDQDAIDFLRHKMVELLDVQRAVEALVEHAIVNQRSTDNVTAVVIMFKEPKDLRDVAAV